MSRILLSKRLHPEPSTPGHPRSAPLSILDAGCARFSPTGAIWVFEGSANTSQDDLSQHLESSFVATLSSFPHWAGQVHWAPYRPQGSHTERFNRPMVTFGSPEDPGVEWTIVRLARKTEDLAPDAASRAKGSQVWVANGFPQAELHASRTPLALHDLKNCQGLPGMLVQTSLLEDGGFAVAIKMAHVLADASSLLAFVHRWAANCRRMLGKGTEQPGETLDTPIFDPQLLDSRASGDSDSLLPNPELVAAARRLPLHRFDWWATSAKSYPSFLAPTTENSKPNDPELLEVARREPASEPPWSTWDMSKAVTHAVIHFTPSQTEVLRNIARDTAPRSSRLDALLAHVWSAINRARDLADDDDRVFLDITLGLRARTSPPLPDVFLGSPLILSHVGAVGREATASDVFVIGNLASRIRSCLEAFTPEAVGALLHDAIHEVSPQRLWRAFLGRRHVLVTSWTRLGVNEVDFVGSGGHPRYAHPIMPYMDGCLQVMDSAAGDRGLDVSLYLESDTMVRLLADPRLLGLLGQ